MKVYVCYIYSPYEFCRHVAVFAIKDSATAWKKETQLWINETRPSDDQHAEFEEFELE